MVRNIHEAKNAEDINELLVWINSGNSLKNKKKRFLVAKNTNFYWSSFNTDKALSGFALENALLDD